MPYRSGYLMKHRHRTRARRHASGTIARAWKKRKQRRRGGLVARTALANRRAIKKSNRAIETNMIELPTATEANQWSGQNMVRIQVDVNGLSSTLATPVVQKPFRELAQGDSSAEREGDWIQCKSLTYKIYVTAVTALLPETNHCGVLIVLDRDPTNTVQPNLVGVVPGTLDQGTLLGGNSQLPHLRYQNMATCGKSLRFKVLRHHKVRVQTTATGAVYPPDQTIIGTLKYPYKLKYPADAPAPPPGVTADAPSNQEILFFFYSDSSLTPHPAFSTHMRFRFKDP